jgi:transposase
MLSFASNMQIFLHARPTDMRKSFDGLCGLVRGVLQADPLDGSLFLFVNRRGDRLKMLWWDRDGLALFYKRLESGTFEMLRPEGEAAAVELDSTTLAMLLGGVSLDSVKRRKRYARAG